MDIVRLLLLSPILCLAGGALGICFISFVRDPKVAGMARGMRNELYLSNRTGVRESRMLTGLHQAARAFPHAKARES